jgi:hypothetical protein
MRHFVLLCTGMIVLLCYEPLGATYFIVPKVDKDCGEGSVFVYRGEVWRRVIGG